jgi:hypothetical protein
MLDATPFLRLYAGNRLLWLAAQTATETQRRQLLRLVTQAQGTQFGQDHRFAEIGGVADFQARVPLRTYDDFWNDYWSADFPRLVDCTWPGPIPFFAETSGTTTGRTKYIPWTQEMNQANTWAGLDILVHHVANRPRSRVLGGLSFMLGGSTGLTELAPGILSGDLSGIASRNLPVWARARYFPPRELEEIADWEKKIDALADAVLDEDIRSISGTPSWLLLFFEALVARRPEYGRRLAEFFPNLELLIHGGVNFAPYEALFADWLEDSDAETREVYVASEGFVAVADRGPGEGMRMILDNRLFYEFVPLDNLGGTAPARHWIATIETGVNYAIAVSSCAGLWAYLIGDTVTFVDRDPPRIAVTGRTSYTLSAFGEHLIDAEIEEAVAAAAAAIDRHVTDYSVGALLAADEGGRGGHLFIVEFAEGVPDALASAHFAQTLDDALAETNVDYKAHRAGDFGMMPPRVHAVRAGTFAAWMKRRGQLGGQHKVPRVINDPDLFADLRVFTGAP